MRLSHPALPRVFASLSIGLGLALTGCSSTYYSVMETFGVEKREILKDRVAEGRTDQEEAKEQFGSTLEAFKAASGFEGGDLERLYEKLAGEFDRCKVRSEDVSDGIKSIQDVATDLFDEWKQETEQYSDPALRDKSRALMEKTRENYNQLVAAMRKAEKSMEPVLDAFNDQVLFLKHNLNAAAISSLYGNVAAIENDVVALIKDMEASIAEADEFVKTLG